MACQYLGQLGGLIESPAAKTLGMKWDGEQDIGAHFPLTQAFDEQLTQGCCEMELLLEFKHSNESVDRWHIGQCSNGFSEWRLSGDTPTT
jgi:hypothetical protein